jgi:glycosyltransferase involved in cell wall biosynthesis
MIEPKKVSIVIPVYNRQELIKECLESIISQTYSNWEAIVVDDGSTDSTRDVVKLFGLKNHKIKLIERNRMPKGASTCRNIGAFSAAGDYIIFLDSDDLLAACCLANRVAYFERHPKKDFIAFPTKLFYQNIHDSNLYWNKPVKKKDDLLRFLDLDMPWHTSGPIWKKNSFNKLGGFDELALSMQDWEIHINAIIDGLSYKVVDDLNAADVYYRRHKEDTISGNYRNKELLLNKSMLLDRVWKNIVDKGKVTSEIKRLYAYFYLHISIELYEKVPFKQSIKIFEKIYEFNLLPINEYIFWRLYLRIFSNSKLNNIIKYISIRILNFIAYKIFDSRVLVKEDRTFLIYADS